MLVNLPYSQPTGPERDGKKDQGRREKFQMDLHIACLTIKDR